ncbi:MAG TPA: hypothetical protein VGG10_20050 [Rhizomicrobium sp.]|jgi:hypothetical protein
MTVAELSDLFLEDERPRVKATTYKTDISRVRCHVKPLLGSRKVISLKMHDIEQLQVDIAAGKSKQRRRESGRGDYATGGRGVAARTVTMMGTMLEFARRRGIVETNVARGVQKFATAKRDCFLCREEYAALGKAMIDAKNFGEHEVALNAIRALALTGCRRQEILGLPWEWLTSAQNASGSVIRRPDPNFGHLEARQLNISVHK